jgi:hypothetical protein
VQLTIMKNMFPSFIANTSIVTNQHQLCDCSVVHTKLTTYLKNPTNKMAPSTRTGPDVIYFVDPSLMVLFSNCTTSKSVGTKVCVSTTDIANICSMKKDGTRVVDPRLEDAICSSLDKYHVN